MGPSNPCLDAPPRRAPATRVRTGAVRALLCVLSASASSACDEHVDISTSPALTPRFDPEILDYVTPCSDAPVRVSVSASTTAHVSVDRRAVPAGSSASVTIGPGQAFPIDVTVGAEKKTYYVRCLPDDFPPFASERRGEPQSAWYVVGLWGFAPGVAAPPGASAQYVAVFDNRGVPVWWRKSSGESHPLDAKLLNNGNIGWLHLVHSPAESNGGAEERTLDGTLALALNALGGPTDHHEYLELANGHYVLARYFAVGGVDLSGCGGPVPAVVLDNEIQELAPDGTLIWSWRAFGHLGIDEVEWPGYCAPAASPHDVYHLNSIEADGDALVVSFRHLNAIYKIGRDGRIRWKLGGSPRPESLAVLGQTGVAPGESLFGGQHDARVLPDGTLTVHDNRTNQPNAVPRALRFRIDELARTATVIETITAAGVGSSACCGSARRLPAGNWVMAWGAHPDVQELAPDGSLVFRLAFTQAHFTYRAQPVLPGVVTREALRAGMDAHNPR